MAGRLRAGEAVARVRAVISHLVEETHAGPRRPAPPGFFRASYLDELRGRLEDARGRSARLDRLLAADRIQVGGRSCRAPLAIARWLEDQPALLARLAPPDLGPLHGDLGPSSILIEPRGSRFALRDPRGPAARRDGDYLEDIARLRASTLALADVMRAGGCALDLGDAGARPAVRWRFDERAWQAAAVLGAMDRALLGWMPDLAARRGDAGWALRLSFLTPLLLLASAPGQLSYPTDSAETTAILLYASGALLLEEAARRVEELEPRSCSTRVFAPR